MIKELDNIFKKTNIYEANYVYIYSDFRHFFKYCKNDPKKNTKLFLELFTKKNITCIIPAFSCLLYTSDAADEEDKKLVF